MDVPGLPGDVELDDPPSLGAWATLGLLVEVERAQPRVRRAEVVEEPLPALPYLGYTSHLGSSLLHPAIEMRRYPRELRRSSTSAISGKLRPFGAVLPPDAAAWARSWRWRARARRRGRSVCRLRAEPVRARRLLSKSASELVYVCPAARRARLRTGPSGRREVRTDGNRERTLSSHRPGWQSAVVVRCRPA